MNARRVTAALLVIGAAVTTARAYDWPVTPFPGPHSIVGVLGEYRDTAPGPHFHNGR